MYDLGYDAYECLILDGVSHETITPSGNVTETFNGTQTVEMVDSRVTILFSNVYDIHFHELTIDQAEQELNSHTTTTFSMMGQPNLLKCTPWRRPPAKSPSG